MRQPTARIYLTANLTVYLFCAIASFPEGLGLGIMAFLFSIVFTAPTILLLHGCFFLLRRYRLGLAKSWLVLLVAVSLCAFIPVLSISLLIEGRLLLDNDFLLICFGCAVSGVLLQGFYINNYFKSLQHETEQFPENN